MQLSHGDIRPWKDFTDRRRVACQPLASCPKTKFEDIGALSLDTHITRMALPLRPKFSTWYSFDLGAIGGLGLDSRHSLPVTPAVGQCHTIKFDRSRRSVRESVDFTSAKACPEFGHSDVGLAKICKRPFIPLPGLGYWTRVQFGKHPKREPLQQLEETAKNQAEIVIQPTSANSILKDLSSMVRAAPVQIRLSEIEPISHPLAIALIWASSSGRMESTE